MTIRKTVFGNSSTVSEHTNYYWVVKFNVLNVSAIWNVKWYIFIERIVLQRIPEIAWLFDSSGLVEECSKNEKLLDGQDHPVPPVQTFTAITHHVTSMQSNHTHFIRIPNLIPICSAFSILILTPGFQRFNVFFPRMLHKEYNGLYCFIVLYSKLKNHFLGLVITWMNIYCILIVFFIVFFKFKILQYKLCRFTRYICTYNFVRYSDSSIKIGKPRDMGIKSYFS